jgi:hypothetical protein
MSSFSSHGDKLKAKLLRRQGSTPSNNIPTTSSSVRSRLFDRERYNLESHQLICCDTNTQNSITRDITLSELRQIIDYTKCFDNDKSCKRYLEETQHIVSFLICSDNISTQLIPEIHHLQNIRSIYVYSPNSEHHQQWSSEYVKVRLKPRLIIMQDHLHYRSSKFARIVNPYFKYSIVMSRNIWKRSRTDCLVTLINRTEPQNPALPPGG